MGLRDANKGSGWQQLAVATSYRGFYTFCALLCPWQGKKDDPFRSLFLALSRTNLILFLRIKDRCAQALAQSPSPKFPHQSHPPSTKPAPLFEYTQRPPATPRGAWFACRVVLVSLHFWAVVSLHFKAAAALLLLLLPLQVKILQKTHPRLPPSLRFPVVVCLLCRSS